MPLRKIMQKAWILSILVIGTALMAQDSGVLSQKLLLETTIQQRVTNAVSRILDETQFVVDVKVELETGSGDVESVYRRPDGTLVPGPGPEGATRPGALRDTEDSGEPRTERTDTPFPIPGFPTISRDEGAEEVRALDGELDDYDIADEAAFDFPDAAATTEALTAGAMAGLMPRIRSMALSIILEDGVTPQIIENVRQVALIASRFNRDRGDELSITTAAFKGIRRQGQAGYAAADFQVDNAKTEELRQNLREAEERNEALMEQLRQRELEYLQRSEDERKQALSDLAQVQNERAKDLIFLQQQREEQNARLQDALLNEISELRTDLTGGGLSPAEKDIKAIQASSLEDSLTFMRQAFDQEKARLQAQIEQAMGNGGRVGAGGWTNNPGLIILLSVIILASAIIAVVVLTNRSSAATQAAMYPPPYVRRKPRTSPSGKRIRKPKPE
ncbi:MAG: hypothetical protein KAU50_07465, partial [Candidatus Marinimicrobia bacterium]|nr:hypothetical protein [Candidatus Neomarinimicrobiota bacterium]